MVIDCDCYAGDCASIPNHGERTFVRVNPCLVRVVTRVVSPRSADGTLNVKIMSPVAPMETTTAPVQWWSGLSGLATQNIPKLISVN